MRIGIIGGGLMGLALAERLGAAGHRTVVFERAAQVGGLATWQDFGSFTWDRFYHVILPSDSALLALLRRIGLGERLRWQPDPDRLLRRRALLLDQQRSRVPALSAARSAEQGAARRDDPAVLADPRLAEARAADRRAVSGAYQRATHVREVLEAVAAREAGRAIPACLGGLHLDVHHAGSSPRATRRRSASSSGTCQADTARCSRGSWSASSSRRASSGPASTWRAVRGAERGGIEVSTPSGVERFDKVIFTGPVDVMRRVVDPALVEVPPPRDVEYLGVVCLVLVSREPVVPYYVVNISDERVPFTGVIGMSSLVDTGETGGRYLTYLPKYVLSGDPLLHAARGGVARRFPRGARPHVPGLRSALDRAGGRSPCVPRAAIAGGRVFEARPAATHASR